MLNMTLIDWIVYYIYVLKEDISQLQLVFLKIMNASNTIDKGLQLWSINKCVIDSFEALEDDVVESLIDQSASLCFVGLYHCLSSYTELYMTDSPLACSWLLLSTAIYVYYKLSSLLLKVHYKTALPLFLPYYLLEIMEIISVASSLKLPAEPCLGRGGNK
jgi:hypothetical protein